MNKSNTSDVNSENGLKKGQSRFLSDPDYKQLLELYQSADFEKCEELIDQLTQKYPSEKELDLLKDDLLLKLSFKDSIDSVTKEEKKKREPRSKSL